MVAGCKGKPTIGGKVGKPGAPGRIYIVPLCEDCAARSGEYMEIVDGVTLVPADVTDTCGPKDAPPTRVRLAEAQDVCQCGSGLKHWEAFSRQRAGYCMVVGCKGKPEIGARVEKIGIPGKFYYVPLCRACASRKDEALDIVHGVHLVSADVRATCRPDPKPAVRVLNLAESRFESCHCGSWLKHWETFSRQRAGYCMVEGCKGKPEVGATVQKEGEPGKVYIVPLCRACAAKQDEALAIVNGVNLVPADAHDAVSADQAFEEINWTAGSVA